MRDYDTATYGERMADIYDDWFGTPGDAEAAAAFLAELAGSGPALELGIGTGRVAVPLARNGVEVHGIDASEAMVERLRTKPGGEDLLVRVGDFADVGVEGTLLAGVRGLQHVLRVAHAGRSDTLLRERREPSG